MVKRILLTLFFILSIAFQAISHPHIFFTGEVEGVFNANGFAGFKTTWHADDFSTVGLTEGYDENENGKIDPAELKMIQEESLENLKQFHYFSYIKVSGKAQPVTEVQQFGAFMKDGKLSYTFFIPCPVPATAEEQTVLLAQYDSSYFAFITFDESIPVRLTGNDSIECDYAIRLNKKEKYYFDMVNPYEMALRFRKK